MSSPRSVLLGQQDLDRIEALIRHRDTGDTELLFDELDGATVLPDHELPDDVVVMNSQVTFVDLDTNIESQVTLIYPGDSAATSNSVSILAPVGAALIGLRVGEHVEWPLPNGGQRRLKVVALRKPQ
ncbi:nucleoside diphosphate kinase regulator [Seongchinamella sediminis]|uniref:Nucleoside diphosphate kinase regulator n=1 Tax=Seongchinamella sediminis TaxID=2283635 RepID=A0A3L7DWS5_9GAMM|nr:nucleoside diphosphate kinase regulator [Seongchinamella sediminis]RLQ20693.1 nucleoside diphosphate kinase regulator [Seongchinamella sediminis]